MTPNPISEEDLSPHERWTLLERVVESHLLKRSTRLREMLLYVGDQTIRQRRSNVREQEIGAAVFGRQALYDTAVDNIVRVNATELRKRLEQYFITEGANETYVLDLPRGGNYCPSFRRRSIETVVDSAPPLEEQAETYATLPDLPAPLAAPPESASHFPSVPLLKGFAIFSILLWAVLAVLLWQVLHLKRQLEPWRADPTLDAFWSPFFNSGAETNIVGGDTSLAIEQLVLKREIPLEEYLSNSYQQQPEPGISPDLHDILLQIRGRNSGSVGDFQTARRIFTLAPYAANLRFGSVKDFLPDAMRTGNVILIGSRASNPWIDLYKSRLNFYVDFQPSLYHPSSRVLNRAPRAGEQESYESVYERGHVGYSVVAFLPNLSPERYVLLIAGTDSQATQAAGVFVTSPEGLRGVSSSPATGHFPYFEVLLRSTRMAGTTLRTEVVATRTTAR